MPPSLLVGERRWVCVKERDGEMERGGGKKERKRYIERERDKEKVGDGKRERERERERYEERTVSRDGTFASAEKQTLSVSTFVHLLPRPTYKTLVMSVLRAARLQAQQERECRHRQHF